MKQNYRTIDSVKLPNKDMAYIRQNLDSRIYYVAVFRNFGFEQVELTHLRCFRDFDECLECFCRLMPDYLAELACDLNCKVEQIPAPKYTTELVDKRVDRAERAILTA